MVNNDDKQYQLYIDEIEQEFMIKYFYLNSTSCA